LTEFFFYLYLKSFLFKSKIKIDNKSNNAENTNQYYSELLKQIEEKKKVLQHLSNTARTTNLIQSVTNSNQNPTNRLEKIPQINSRIIENLINSKIESIFANTNSKNLKNLNMQNPNQIKDNPSFATNRNLSNNYNQPRIPNNANKNYFLRNDFSSQSQNATNFKFDEIKKLLLQTQMKAINENSGLIEKMKDQILIELKPILKLITDMQFFTYKKIKNIENSFGKIKNFHAENNFFNKTIEDISELTVPNLDYDSSEVGKLARLSNMPEVDDLSNFVIEDGKSVSKSKEENFSKNKKVKYNRNIRKPSNGLKENEVDNTHKVKISKSKNDKYNDP
jgi:hypothetical protein